MLTNQNQLARELHSLSRIEVTVDNQPASRHDRDQFLTVCVMRIGLECDLLPGTTFRTSGYRRVLHGLNRVDLKQYAKDMKVCKTHYLQSFEDTPRTPWQSFKRSVSREIHYKWVLAMLGRMYSSPAAALQWLAFDERLQTDTNSDFSDEIAAYIEFEETLRSYEYPPEIIEDLATIIGDWFSDFELATQTPKPHFGPGATAYPTGRISKLDKFRNFNPDPLVTDLYCDLLFRDNDELWPPVELEASYVNRIVFVPKNALKHRVISAEPVWLTWGQQLLKESLYSYVESHPRMYSWFSNQEASRQLALLGSLDGSYATIDFSSASDSFTVTLVAEAYSKTSFCELLLRTRSTQAIMPDDSLVRLTKFAPMGSATCFVTMDVIFLALCELAIRIACGRVSRRGDYVVYGDDVIIRSEAYTAFVQLCKDLHLEINEDKTCRSQCGMRYRESCGIEALNGVDITPVRYSRSQKPLCASAPVSRDWWESTTDLLNQLLIHHLYNTRSACVELIKHSIGRGKPAKCRLSRRIWENALRVDISDYQEGFDGPLSIVVPDGTATNFHQRRRYNDAYQICEVRCLTPAARPLDYHEPDDADLAYQLWFYEARRYDRLVWDGDGQVNPDSILTGCAGTTADKWVWQWCGL